jgi:acyl-CoA thioester hydrolase
MSSRFTIRFSVRFRDIDAIGHVNNAVYFTYMESARTEYWMKLFEVKDLRDVQFIVARAECDFKVAARFGDELEVSIWTSSIGNTSFVWDYEIRNAISNQLVASGKTIQVYYDYANQKAIPVPNDVRTKLLSF